MKLYFAPKACSLSPHIVLNELGMKYEAVKVDLQNRSPEFKKEVPKGQVPALVTDKGELLTEGAVIVQYLADQKPEANLIPKAGTWERYRAMEMLNFIASELHKGFGPIFHVSKMGLDDAGAERVKNYAKENLVKKFGVLNEALQGKQYLLGNFSVVDAYAYTMITWSKRAQIDLSKYTDLMGYSERMEQRPAVQATLKQEA